MRFSVFACLVALWFTASGFDTHSPKTLEGAWTSIESGGGASGWVFEQKGAALRVAEMKGTDKLAEFECGTDGRECEFKDAGKKANVSMWFNGPKLVQLITQGSQVVKRRFTISADGNELEVEVMPVAPAGKTETSRYKRADLAAQNK